MVSLAGGGTRQGLFQLKPSCDSMVLYPSISTNAKNHIYRPWINVEENLLFWASKSALQPRTPLLKVCKAFEAMWNKTTCWQVWLPDLPMQVRMVQTKLLHSHCQSRAHYFLSNQISTNLSPQILSQTHNHEKCGSCDARWCVCDTHKLTHTVWLPPHPQAGAEHLGTASAKDKRPLI